MQQGFEQEEQAFLCSPFPSQPRFQLPLPSDPFCAHYRGGLGNWREQHCFREWLRAGSCAEIGLSLGS